MDHSLFVTHIIYLLWVWNFYNGRIIARSGNIKERNHELSFLFLFLLCSKWFVFTFNIIDETVHHHMTELSSSFSRRAKNPRTFLALSSSLLVIFRSKVPLHCCEILYEKSYTLKWNFWCPLLWLKGRRWNGRRVRCLHCGSYRVSVQSRKYRQRF